MTALWKVIPGFSRYSVSDAGEVRRDVQMHRTPAGSVAQRIDSHGYLSVNLSSDAGPQRKLQVHTLVARAFLGLRPHGLVVCHGLLGGLNNRIENLRYGTQASNIEDQRCMGTMLVGSKHPTSKLCEEQVAEILRLVAARGLSHTAIGKQFGVDGAAIGRMAAGKTWRHVPRPADMPPPRYSKSRTKKFRQAKAADREGAAA